MGIKEVAITDTAVARRGYTGGTFEHILPVHELAVVFPDSPGGGGEAGESAISRRGPLPDALEGVFQGAVLRRVLPFGLGRQPGAGPARIGVGLEIADVGNGGRGIESFLAAQRHLPAPGRGASVAPMERRRNVFARPPGPAVAQPERRLVIAAVIDKAQPVAIADQPRRDGKRLQPHLVARIFVVEAEALAVVADL